MNWFPPPAGCLRLIAGLFLASWCCAAAEPGAGEWTTFGNGPAHTGYYPKTIGAAPFTAGWTKSFPTSVNQVAVSGDTIYATTNGYFTANMRAFALRVADGSEKWIFPLADAYSVNPPSYANGRVYFQRGNHAGDTHLWCLDAASGTLQWAAPHEAQWERYKAPTVVGGGVFVDGGSYGGMYGFDAGTGARRFFVNNLGQEDGWTPSYADGVVYACVNGIFTAFDPASGAQLWTRDLKTTSTGSTYWNSGDVPVISAGRAAIAGGGRLVVMDLAARAQLWSLSGNFTGTPAIAGGVVYAFLGSEVKAYDAATGALAGTFNGMGTDALVDQPLLTADLLIVASGTRTFVFDRATFTKLQTLQSGGTLTYAAGTLYVVSVAWNSPSTLATYRVAASEPDPVPDPLPPPPPPQSRPNPSRPLGSTTAAWLDSTDAGGIAYFLFDSPAKLERYELASGTWLAPISLPSGPKAFAVSSQEIFVSFGTAISKFSLDGATETPLTTLAAEARSLFALNGRVYLLNQYGQNFTVIDASTGRLLQVKNLSDSQTGVSVAATKNKFFGRSNGYTPSDILQTVINSDGTLGAQSDSPYHGDYPTATRTFLFPGEARVIDDAGIIYSSGDLSYLGSLAGAFNDIDFAGDAPVVLRNNNTLVAYSTALAETGRAVVTGSPSRISIGNGFVHSFGLQSGRGVAAAKTPLDQLVPLGPGTGIDPTDLAYTPDAIEFGAGDIVYLLSKLNQSVFRWSLSQRRYLESIPLNDIPQLMAYSPTHHRLYLSYATGRVTKIDLDAGLTQSDFTNLAGPALAMTPTDAGLFVSRANSSSSGKETYDASGAFVAAEAFGFSGSGYIWSQPTRRLYSISAPYQLQSQVIDTEGQFGARASSSFASNLSLRLPVRVAPDGSRIVLGDGGVYAASDLARLGTLPVPAGPPTQTWPYIAPALVDAAWLSGQLYTLRQASSGGEVQAWSPALQATDSASLAGTPLRLLSAGERLLVIALKEGKPRFTMFNAALESGGPLPGGPVTRPNPARPPGTTTAVWLDAQRGGDIAYFLFEVPAKIERYDLANGVWLAPISLPAIPSAFCVGADGIYVAFDANVSRFSFDGTSETLLFDAPADVRWLRADAGRLYFGTLTHLVSYNRADIDTLSVVSSVTGELLSRREFAERLSGLSFATSRQRILARAFQGIRSDFVTIPFEADPGIIAIPVAADGSIGAPIEGQDAADRPYATRTFLFPDESRVLDGGGSIYAMDDLTFRATIGGNDQQGPIFFVGDTIADVAFAGGVPIVLRDGKLEAFSADLLETGRKALTGSQLCIFTSGTDVISFARQNGRGIAETRTPLSEIGPPPPAPAIDPTDLWYNPDALLMNGDVVFILSKTQRCVFRWSLSQRRYLTTVPLAAAPNLFAVSADGQSLYLAYPGGRITTVDLVGAPHETTFGYTPETAGTFVAAEEFLFASAASGQSSVRYVFSASGHLLSRSTGAAYPSRTAWNSATRKVFSFASSYLSSQLLTQGIDTAGVAGSEQATPLIGYGFPSGQLGSGAALPVAPNGSAVVLPNGNVYETVNFTRVASLGAEIRDATWMPDTLFTLGLDYSATQLRTWSADYQMDRSVSLPGTPLRIFPTAEGALVVTLVNARPHFALFDRDLHALPLAQVDLRLVRGAFFASLVADPNGAGPAEGVITLSLSASGRATGALLIAGARLNFFAQFDTLGRATASLALRGQPLVLSLQLAPNAEGKWIVTGTLEGAAWSMELNGTRAERKVPPGRYVFDLRGSGDADSAPAIAGCGSLTVSSGGRARIAGSLATSRAFSGAAWVSSKGTLALSCRTSSGANALSGTIQYADLTASDWTGYLHWTKPANDPAIQPGSRLATFLALTGAAYDGQPGALGAGAGAQVDLTISGGDLPADFVRTVFLEARGPRAWGVHLDTLNLLVEASGLIRGRFFPSQKGWVGVLGAVNQKTQSASGYFRSGTHFGEMRIVPHQYSGGSTGGVIIIFGNTPPL